MTRLALRRGVVTAIESEGPAARIRVRIGDEERSAIAYLDMTGPVEQGDEVVVNIAARDLDLGSGGFDIVHVNLTRGLHSDGEPGTHVMKLNYTSLQHAFDPVETLRSARPGDVRSKPVAVLALHGQLPCVAWAAAQRVPDAWIGYIQTWGGALAGALSDTVRELRGRNLLAGHITAGQAFGGEHEAVSLEGAIAAGLEAFEWDAAIIGPGPGIIGSDTALGHGGMAALESTHAALAMGAKPVLVPRMSSGDPRERHHGLSHHSKTVLALLLREIDVAMPDSRPVPGHRARPGAVDLDGYRGSGLPARTMGRGIDEDELFFRAALAGGAVLAEEIDGVRAGRQ
ncbi:MAG: DUF3866 family protein [Thermoleophilaceae bacterium]